MTTTTYTIGANNGADDVSVCDWNTRIGVGVDAVSFGYNPSATALRVCAPSTTFDAGLDNTSTRTGVLFRGITLGAGEQVHSATLRLYLEGWQPDGWADPNYGTDGAAAIWVHVYGAKVFAPAPGYNECPGPSAPGWGNLPATAISDAGTGVCFDSFVTGSGVPTQWASPPQGWHEESPSWSGVTRNWHPARFDSISNPETVGTGSSETVEIGRRTETVTAVGVARSAGYVDIDVTAQLNEIRAHDFAAPDWTARTYKYGELPNGSALTPLRAIPQVYNPGTGYVYTFVGSGVPWGNGGFGFFVRGLSGASATAPTGTAIGGEEQPDGAGTAIWRCAQQGNIRNWQSGDNVAFILVPRVSGVVPQHIFPEACVYGWRDFTAGDAGIPAQAPLLVIEHSIGGAGIGAATLTGATAAASGAFAQHSACTGAATLTAVTGEGVAAFACPIVSFELLGFDGEALSVTYY